MAPLAKDPKAAYTPNEYDIDAFARCIFPAIKAYYDSEEGQREFAKWKAKQAEKGQNPED